jgi:hypothetical protein
MGTDIHPRIEIWRKGHWFDVTDHLLFNQGKSRDWHNLTSWDYLDARNYTLFAILAGVRNHDNEVSPISEFRGIPVDSPSYDEEDLADTGSHSRTWVSLRELLDYDWERKTKQSGVIPEEQWIHWRKQPPQCPGTWSKWIHGRDCITLSHEEAERLLDDQESQFRRDEHNQNIKYYVKIFWESSLRERVDGFVEHTIPWLQKYVRDPNDLRIVMWFDS